MSIYGIQLQKIPAISRKITNDGFGTNFNFTVTSHGTWDECRGNPVPMDKPVDEIKLRSRLTHKHLNETRNFAARQDLTSSNHELVKKRKYQVSSAN